MGDAPLKFKVIWDNGHACGALPGEYDTVEDAITAGESWHAEMCAVDEDPLSAEDVYSYEIEPVKP